MRQCIVVRDDLMLVIVSNHCFVFPLKDLGTIGEREVLAEPRDARALGLCHGGAYQQNSDLCSTGDLFLDSFCIQL